MSGKIFFPLLLLSFLATAPVVAQLAKPAETETEFEQNYEWRIRQEHLDGIYIPKDLVNAFEELNRLIEPQAKATFKAATEDEVVHKLFFSLGRWISQKWGFYEGSRLSHYLKTLGVTHPEDMSQVVIVSYHRYLLKNPLDIKAQIEAIKEKRKKEHEERMKKGTVIELERKKSDRN